MNSLASTALILPLALAFASCIDCSESEYSGTYLVSFSERPNGSCGPISDQLSGISSAPNAGCELVRQDFRDNSCTEEIEFSCVDRDDGTSSRITRILTMSSPDADTLEGITTLNVVTTGTGQFICTSTYDMIAERQ